MSKLSKLRAKQLAILHKKLEEAHAEMQSLRCQLEHAVTDEDEFDTMEAMSELREYITSLELEICALQK